MEASYLPLELTSVDALQCSLRRLEEGLPKVDNKVHLHHGPNSVAIRSKSPENGFNGIVKPNKTLVDLVREEWRPLESPFLAHPLLQSGHLQTLYAAACNFTDVDRVFYARKLLEMSDGGTAGLDIVLESEGQFKKGTKVDEALKTRKDYVQNLPPRIRYMCADEEPELLQSNDDRPMLIAFHGLSGGSHESYLRAVLGRMVSNNSKRWAACSLNARGCGRTAITTQQLFCANWTSDIRTTMKFLKERFPNRRFYAVGFSLGANMLCNYLGEQGKDTPFVAAVAISNPWHLKVTADALWSTFLGRELYSKTMGCNLKKMFLRHHEVMKDHPKIDWKAFRTAKYIHEFDAAVTAPIFGHATWEDYYNIASSTNNLPKIKTPLLILHALDDPIASESGIPWDEIAANEYSVLAYTHCGGHLGWYMWGGSRWFVIAVGDFFELIEGTLAR